MDIETFGSSCKYRYSARDFIARGSFGEVYKANITESNSCDGNEIVAVKYVHLHEEVGFFANRGIRKKLSSRWEKMFDLKHNHLLAYYKASIFRTHGGITVEFMMDYYNEGDLDALLSSSKLRGVKKPFDQEAVICFALQLADGLTFLLQNCIIHGDIKPGNILVKSTASKHRKLAIGDWDEYVQIQPGRTSAVDMSLFHGTVRYMSPEMLRNKCLIGVTTYNDNIGCKTDVWSLGCVLLDLANCSVGNTEKCLHKETKVRMVKNLSDCTFVRLIDEGWVPFIADPIPASVAACIQECLRTDHISRISADKLLEKLRDTATKLHASRPSTAGEHAHQECFCSFA